MLVNVSTFIGEPNGARFSANGIASRAAGILDWDDDTTDDTPDFTYATSDMVENDTARLEWYSDVGLTALVGTSDNVVSAGEAGTQTLNFVVGILPDGVYYFRAEHFPSGGGGTWSNTEVVTIATLAAMPKRTNIIQLRRPSIIRPRRFNIVGQRAGLLLDATTSTTWNPSDKSASLTLSGGNLTATNPGSNAWRFVRSIASKSSGKYYYEVLADVEDAAGDMCAGIANSGGGITYLGGDVNISVGCYFASPGTIYRDSASRGTVGAVADNQVVGIAFDLDNDKIWIKNVSSGGGWNNDVIGNQNPATNTGGISIALVSKPIFACVSQYNLNSQTVARFASGSWTGSAPSGFVELA